MPVSSNSIIFWFKCSGFHSIDGRLEFQDRRIESTIIQHTIWGTSGTCAGMLLLICTFSGWIFKNKAHRSCWEELATKVEYGRTGTAATGRQKGICESIFIISESQQINSNQRWYFFVIWQAFSAQFRRMVELEKKLDEERKRFDHCQQNLIKSKVAEKQVGRSQSSWAFAVQLHRLYCIWTKHSLNGL